MPHVNKNNKNADAFGDRMKKFEAVSTANRLLPQLPICMRIDGRAFHTFTKGMSKPYCEEMSKAMINTMKALVDEFKAVIGYTQSDEITLILPPLREPMFDGKLSKLNSIGASVATAVFNRFIHKSFPDKPDAYFDCRAWNVPSEMEATNVLLWREFDCIKNSISSACYANGLTKASNNKNSAEKIALLKENGIIWSDYPRYFTHGTYAKRIVETRKFSEKELDALPPKHAARMNPNLGVTRSYIAEIYMPELKTVMNRTDVIFNDAKPQVAGENI